MTDSPAIQAPLDPKEEPILARVLELRDKLSILKQDKSTYVKSQDIIPIYEQVIEQVQSLNTIRTDHGKPLESNRVDRVLDDAFQLISLFFLTIGRNNDAPAVYSFTSTIRRLLDHLKEAAFFSAKDLESIGHNLDKMQDVIKRGKEHHPPHLLTLLQNRMDICWNILAELRDSLSNLSPTLTPIHERLVSILRSISAANTRYKFPSGEVEGFRNQLKEIKATMVNGQFLGEDSTAPSGQDIVTTLLDRCLLWSDIVLSRCVLLKKGKIDQRFKETYEKLSDIRNQLERLSLTQAWSLRETDLYNFQRQLDRVDESRINGNFEDGGGNLADLHAQRTLLYLLRRSYAYIYQLMISSEPVSEALLPIFNQLQTLRRCLVEVKRSGGVTSARELYPYSMKLSSIDNMRVDGKFMVGTDIPEGQGSVSVLLAECFELQHDLKIEAEEREAKVPGKDDQ
ncbi:uncharacterized protein KY384_006930 [Bacidia gigantensis]|uniref:uncharacterized protein n=1 Tax=Bacidia gigantensis TaxID=2732470 RepID=UPI001D04468E|nr:uncharacterized protein KY384_006930 [Bacidia gigantensis]KAG8528014.1 hypothetical protein KY384_006930 [Bacidia gigantensis]